MEPPIPQDSIGKHSIIVPLQSGIVGGMVFLLFDLLCLWAIHRGLMAFQAFWIARRSASAKSVRLKRTRVPIVGGELLEISSSWKSFNFFVLANVISMGIAFWMALGINGETISVQKPMIDPPSYQNELQISPQNKVMAHQVFSKCQIRTKDGITFYPMAFNVQWNAILHDLRMYKMQNGSIRFVNGSTGSCQWNETPLMSISDCWQCISDRHLQNLRVGVTFYTKNESMVLAKDESKMWKWWESDFFWWDGFEKTSTVVRTVKSSSDVSILSPFDRLHCVSFSDMLLNTTVQHFPMICVIGREDGRSRFLRIAFGRMEEVGADLLSRTYIFLPEAHFGTLKTYSDVEYLQHYFMGALYNQRISFLHRPWKQAPHFTFAEHLVSEMSMSKRITSATKQVNQDVTVIGLSAIVCMCVLIFLAVVGAPSQEILTIFTRWKYGFDQAQYMNINRYDFLSQIARLCNNGVHSVGEITSQNPYLHTPIDTDSDAISDSRTLSHFDSGLP